MIHVCIPNRNQNPTYEFQIHTGFTAPMNRRKPAVLPPHLFWLPVNSQSKPIGQFRRRKLPEVKSNKATRKMQLARRARTRAHAQAAASGRAGALRARAATRARAYRTVLHPAVVVRDVYIRNEGLDLGNSLIDRREV